MCLNELNFESECAWINWIVRVNVHEWIELQGWMCMNEIKCKSGYACMKWIVRATVHKWI